jgi:DNA polymerase-3 subunit alpha
MSFVHLRLHTEFSLVDSTLRIKKMMPAVEAGGMPAIAMTDQNNLFAMVKFYRAAMGQGLKPVFGVDVLLQDENDKDLRYHMILLCQNNEGYLNISKLISKAYQEGQVLGIPLVQRSWVKELSNGVIALSGAKSGDVGYSIMAGNTDEAERRLKEWKEVFPDRYYVELQRTERVGDERYLQTAVELAVKHDLPVVATNDVRFLTKEDFSSHEARVCIHDGYTLADKRREKVYSEEQYLKSAEEMKELFKDIPSAVENTVEIAKRCTVELTLGKNYLPAFPIPEGMTEAEYFCQVSREGLEERFPEMLDVNSADFAELRKPYDERLQIELDVINGMGFPGYFLIVADFIQWGKDNDVPIGPGRGSGAGSLVAFVLKITDIDPLKYDLLFERFLNPERVSMPDFDIDFCTDKREMVIDYVAETYGRDKVSQIITYGSMAAKAVVRDVGRILAHPYGFVDRIAKLIPFEMKMTLSKALVDSPDLKELYDEDEEVKSLIDLALSLEGLTRNVGKHAGGVLISPSALVDFTPLYCEEGGGSLVSQFDKDDVEAVGLVKFDFLGLRNLTVIDWTVKIVNKMREEKGEEPLDIAKIDLGDKKAFDLLRSAKTTAVFQLESRGMKELIGRLQPDVFEDIIALVALYRPGPLQSGMVDDFVNRKKGIAAVEYPHEDLEPVLNTTYGVIVYQEQVMQIAQILAGYSLGGADMLRRAMGKKKPEEMAKQREIFMEGSGGRNIDPAQATAIFDLMEKFAEYGFNKSHSAAYALVSFQTIWLKAHYPAAFMAAVLSSDMDNTEKVVTFIDDCRQFNLEVIPPDVNRSSYRFTTEHEGNVVFGLGAIKGAGESAIGVILAEREANGPFESMADVLKRVKSNKLSKRVLETLINAGVFDSLGKNRQSMSAHLPEVIRMASQLHKDEDVGQSDLFGGSMVVEQDIKLAPDLAEYDERERLRMEKKALGLYLTGHPINEYEAEIKQMRSMRLADLEEDSTQKYQKHPVVLAGLVSAIRTQSTEKGKRAFVQLDDKTSYYEVFIFSNVFEEYEHLVEMEEVLIISGTLNTEYHTGNTRLRIEALYNMQEARNIYARSLRLNVGQAAAQNGFVDQLKALIPPEGESECPILLSYENDQATAQIRFGADYKAPLDNDSLKTLRGYLGDDNVVVNY